MFYLDVIIALIFALALAALLFYPLGRRGPGPMEGILFFFLILFLAIWAGGLWLVPVGPALWGAPWLSFLITGVILALILAAATPPRRPVSEPPPEPPPEGTAGALAVSLGAFFYVLLLALFAAVIVYYLA